MIAIRLESRFALSQANCIRTCEHQGPSFLTVVPRDPQLPMLNDRESLAFSRRRIHRLVWGRPITKSDALPSLVAMSMMRSARSSADCVDSTL
jgi:hypothetical protein